VRVDGTDPRAEAERLVRGPRDHPFEYPGARPDHSFLFTGRSVLTVEPLAHRPLGEARVVPDPLDPDPFDRPSSTGADRRVRSDAYRSSGLDECLADLGVASMGERFPVLAYGSNASPGQLVAKLARTGVGGVVPVIRASVSGISVVHTAHICAYGAIPASVLAELGARSEVHATFLDEAQRVEMDATEGGYDVRLLEPAVHPVVVANGERLRACPCYVAGHGVLALGGRPVRLAAVPAAGSTLPARHQRGLYAELVEAWSPTFGGVAAGPVDVVRRVRSGGAGHAAVLEDLHEFLSGSGSVVDDGLAGCLAGPSIRYAEQFAGWSVTSSVSPAQPS
jgi:hypothetical protein